MTTAPEVRTDGLAQKFGKVSAKDISRLLLSLGKLLNIQPFSLINGSGRVPERQEIHSAEPSPYHLAIAQKRFTNCKLFDWSRQRKAFLKLKSAKQIVTEI